MTTIGPAGAPERRAIRRPESDPVASRAPGHLFRWCGSDQGWEGRVARLRFQTSESDPLLTAQVALFAWVIRMSGVPLRFRLAVDRDVPEIASLLTEAAEYAKRREGFEGWPIPFPAEDVRAAIRREEDYVIDVGTRIAATFYFSWSDIAFWGDQPPIAGYVHKLAVRRAFAHQGLGRMALEWVVDRTRAAGGSRVRLDCHAANRYLVTFYESLGFRPVRTLELVKSGRLQPYLLMERALR
jgi:ribosomal protein S18 acetylase RimI-like enzyme